MVTKIGERAVVLGAGMAGLMAARVLADAYERVTIVERDELPDGPVHRRGVPQGRHAHALLARGCQLVEDLFDGISTQLIADGALPGDLAANFRAVFSGHRLAQTPSDLSVLFLSRPLLESRIRARVRAIPAVTILDGTDALGVVATADARRIVGVRVVGRRERANEETIATDLVVDATGRGSRAPAWLAQLGFREPRPERVEVGVRYSTRAFRLREGALGHDHLVVVNGTPANLRSGVVLAIEGGVHLCSVIGLLGDTPPTDLAEFLAFAGSLLFPDVHDAIVDAVPLDDGARLGYPANVRLHYEELREQPSGLLVLGDALCSLNPVYAQGMTVAAMQAGVLRRLLQSGAVSPDQYFNEVARVIDVPWNTATAADLLRNGVAGFRGLGLRLVDAYISRLQAAAANDPELTLAFLRVVGLVDPPSELLRPSRVAKVLKGGAHKTSNGNAYLRGEPDLITRQ